MGGDTSYAGRHRENRVMTGGTQFCSPEEVPIRMTTFVKDFNRDVYSREDTGELIPFYLAADVAQDFVMMHPFSDGNGRMSRLLLNAYLVKCAGVVMDIGLREERNEYMSIAKEASGVDEDGELLEEVARAKLGRFVLKRATMSLRRLKGALCQN